MLPLRSLYYSANVYYKVVLLGHPVIFILHVWDIVYILASNRILNKHEYDTDILYVGNKQSTVFIYLLKWYL